MKVLTLALFTMITMGVSSAHAAREINPGFESRVERSIASKSEKVSDEANTAPVEENTSTTHSCSE